MLLFVPFCGDGQFFVIWGIAVFNYLLQMCSHKKGVAFFLQTACFAGTHKQRKNLACRKVKSNERAVIVH